MKDLVNDIGGLVKHPNEISETFNYEEQKELFDELRYPDLKLQPFDVTYEAWLIRLSLWGEISIHHLDKENGINKKVSQDEFLKKVANPSNVEYKGLWRYVDLNANTVRLYRDYIGNDGKCYSERYDITIKIKPELKNATRKWYNPLTW